MSKAKTTSSEPKSHRVTPRQMALAWERLLQTPADSPEVCREPSDLNDGDSPVMRVARAQAAQAKKARGPLAMSKPGPAMQTRESVVTDALLWAVQPHRTWTTGDLQRRVVGAMKRAAAHAKHYAPDGVGFDETLKYLAERAWAEIVSVGDDPRSRQRLKLEGTALDAVRHEALTAAVRAIVQSRGRGRPKAVPDGVSALGKGEAVARVLKMIGLPTTPEAAEKLLNRLR